MIKAQQIQKLIKRIEKLEVVVFGSNKKSQKLCIKKTESFKGPKGGCQYIMARGFLNKKRSVNEVREELEDHDYHYSRQVVQTALNRMSKPRGPLVSLKGKLKMYVRRK